MAKKAKSTEGLTIKEETLNQIVAAQKEKIAALTDFGKKLKAQLKDCKDQAENNCDDLIVTFNEEFKQAEHLHQRVLVMATIGALLFGVFLGMII